MAENEGEVSGPTVVPPDQAPVEITNAEGEVIGVLYPDGRKVMFGIKPRPKPKKPRATMARKLSSYFPSARALPSAPASVDYYPAASPCLHDALGNDAYGDCTIAAAYHLLAVVTAENGEVFTATEPMAYADYSAITGYDGNSYNDFGADVEQVFQYYMRDARFANGAKMIAWVELDPRDAEDIKTAIWLFSGMWITVLLPPGWTSAFQHADGFVWDVGAGTPAYNHAVALVGYDATGVKVSSWGYIGTITWAGLAHYVGPDYPHYGQATVWFTQSHIDKADAASPDGIAWAQLVADFNELGQIHGYGFDSGLGYPTYKFLRPHVKRGRFWRNGRRAESF